MGEDCFPDSSHSQYRPYSSKYLFLSSVCVIGEAKFGSALSKHFASRDASDFTSPRMDVFERFHGSFQGRSIVACQFTSLAETCLLYFAHWVTCDILRGGLSHAE